MIRLQKFLAQAGVASRRKAEEYIAQGRVQVNGETVTEPGTKLDAEQDRVCFDGQDILSTEPLQYYMLHKPEGTITTVRDECNRDTVMGLLQDIETRLYPVGRLDYDSSGLLLLTNDGELAYRLTHPKHEADKVYIARLRRRPSAKELVDFRRGLEIDGRQTAPAHIELLPPKGEHTTARITIHEGRNRQVRKMCEAIGCPVLSLKRVAIGKLHLGSLPKGAYRKLTKSEIEQLKSL